MVWQSYRDADTTGVSGQRFDNTGQAIGTEFQVNGRTANDQRADGSGLRRTGPSWRWRGRAIRTVTRPACSGGTLRQRGAVGGRGVSVNGFTVSPAFPAVARGRGRILHGVGELPDGSGYGVLRGATTARGRRARVSGQQVVRQSDLPGGDGGGRRPRRGVGEHQQMAAAGVSANATTAPGR